MPECGVAAQWGLSERQAEVKGLRERERWTVDFEDTFFSKESASE
jgi:hypothetical protein